MLHEILDFINDNIDLLFFVLALLNILLTFLKTKDLSKLKEDLKDMKYKLPNYRETEKPNAVKFSEEVSQYVLNENTGELKELPVKKNIQDEINSFKDVDLVDSIERLMPVTQEAVDDTQAAVDMMRYNFDALDALREAEEYRIMLCDKYGYGYDTSLNDIIIDLEKENKQLLDNLGYGGKKNESSQVEKKSE